MNNQLIKKEDISIFDKIRGFFRKIFNKKDKKKESNEILEQDSGKKINEFEKSIKVEKSNLNAKERELKEFIKEIENNPDIIDNLSNDRLDKLIKYYDNITNAKRIKIEKLKSQIS